TFLSRVRVHGTAAVIDSNVRVVQYGSGTVVIPQSPTFAAMEVFDGRSFTGASKSLRSYDTYADVSLGSLKTAISSFRLKRGYTATVATNENGTGVSRNYVAQDGDLDVSALPASLENKIRFIRIFPWRWVSKKGSCDVDPVALKANWHYNWNISLNSTRDWEYVAIKQQPYWPGLGQDWRARGVNHLSGFNEPNNPVEDAYENLSPPGSVSDAVARWPELLGTGLRVGAPAVTDGGFNWIRDFINQADAAGHRVDYVPVHYYRSYWNKTDPVGAANQLYSFLKSIYDVAQRPIWVTEFNNGANWTDNAHDPDVTQNRDAIDAMINMMDNTPWIERYSVYSRVEWFRQTHYDDGSITPMGAMYRDHVAPVGYVQEVPAPGISAAAHFSFDGDFRDALVNGNDAMAVGAPIFAAGKYGAAISLDGSTDYLQLPAQLGDSTDFTFAAWVNWNGGGNWQRIFDFGAGGTDNYLFLTPKSGTNTLRFGIKQGGSEQTLDTAVLPTGTWTHVAVTLTGSTAKIFVNGTLRATNSGMTFNPGDLNTKYNYLGRSQWPDPLFNGKLDDVRIFTTGLSDAQVAAIAGNAPPQFGATTYTASATKLQPFTGSMATHATGGNGTRTFTKVAGPGWLAVAADGTLTGVPGMNDGGVNRILVRVTDSIGALSITTLDITVSEATGLVARYAFDGNANASAGLQYHGTTAGSPAYGTGVNGSAIDLDGTDDSVSLPANLASESEITIASWFWRDSDSNWQRVFDFGTGTSEYMFLSPRSNAGTIRFAIKNGGSEQALTAPMLPAGQWVHVAVTLGDNDGKLYVNGALADTDTITIKPTDFLHDYNYIGKSQWPDPLFNGRIDEFAVFNQVLNATQIAALANSTNRAPVFTTDPIPTPAAIAGEVYEHTIAGNATDPNAGSTLTYSKVSGPAWLAVSPSGRISGMPSTADAGANRFLVRVTDATLLADDATLNIAVGNPGGLLAHYQFDGSTADNLGGAAGTTTGSPAYATGAFDRALRFDGSDDVVRLRSGLLNGVTDLTIATRVRWDGGGDWQRIFDFGNSTTQYLFLSPKGGSSLRFAIKNGGSEQVLDGPALTSGDWTHVAVTLVGNTGTLYLNGAAVATGSITIDPSAISPTINYLADSQYAADPLFNGVIDDFRIYNRGLGAAEVSALAVPAPVVNVPDSSYAGWADGIEFPAGDIGGLSDPDTDGLNNAWEYVFGSNPLIAGSATWPQQHIRTAAELGLPGNKSYLTMQARVRKQRLGTALVAEAASTVQGLAAPDASTHAIQAGAPVADGQFEIITYYYDIPIEDSPTGVGAIRLKVNIQ
ncbi:MAG TPA: LamG-like jellyroll fold domain-containing protein, partial [Chthoniobacteraceae bacterium]|nr:LamG-like jellyroll fold domain-containing protein [Chthoniobacteraceae bacterium]